MPGSYYKGKKSISGLFARSDGFETDFGNLMAQSAPVDQDVRVNKPTSKDMICMHVCLLNFSLEEFRIYLSMEFSPLKFITLH